MNSARRILSTCAALALMVHAGIATALGIRASDHTSIFFAQNSEGVTAEQKEKLRRFADRVDQHQLQVVIVIGHASPTERDPQLLSERRAASAKFELIQLGVPPYRIYTEGKGDTQASYFASTGTAQQVEIEYVGTPRPSGYSSGFNALWTWHADLRMGKAKPSLGSPPSPWEGMTPLQFLPAIADPALRMRFLDKYRMVAIHERDDALLSTIQGLRPAGAPPADAQTALMAFHLGSPAARSEFSSALDRLDVTEAGGRAFVERLWCGDRWRPDPHDANTQRMKIPQMLRALPALAQKRWTECASTGFGAAASLAFLKSNGVDLNARDVRGQTALHTAVRRFNRAAIDALVAAGADVNAQDSDGRTPLHELENASHGPMFPRPLPTRLKEAWDVLVAAGANPMLQDHRGAAPDPIRP